MNHLTSIGLDVHARSVAAAAFNPFTGEVISRSFGYEPKEIAGWIKTFKSPKAVYESGVTGFDLARKLNEMGVECVVGAVSKMVKPSADMKRKNDHNDAVYLAKLLATHNVVEVMVPDKECEAARDLVRAYIDCSQALTRSRLQLTHFLMRHGLVFNEKNSQGNPVSNWTKGHWAWMRDIDFHDESDEETFAFYIAEVRHLEATKKQLVRFICTHAREPRWKGRVEALRCLKGIETVTAFTLVVEANVFSRFDSAKAFACWAGLVPSEHSSGERKATGGITKTGNSIVRRSLVEAAWCYMRATTQRKERPSEDVSLSIENHAARATKRLVKRGKALKELNKKPQVINCAIARELACFVWSIGRMAEGALV